VAKPVKAYKRQDEYETVRHTSVLIELRCCIKTLHNPISNVIESFNIKYASFYIINLYVRMLNYKLITHVHAEGKETYQNRYGFIFEWLNLVY